VRGAAVAGMVLDGSDNEQKPEQQPGGEEDKAQACAGHVGGAAKPAILSGTRAVLHHAPAFFLWIDHIIRASAGLDAVKRLLQSSIPTPSRRIVVPVKPSDAFQAHRAAIRRIVEANRARNPRVFGSVAQGCGMEGSDLDVLVDPTPETTMFDIGAIRHALLELLGVPVDVLTPRALPEKFRAAVLAEAIPV
jgi:predicted nucleotidyltransferase